MPNPDLIYAAHAIVSRALRTGELTPKPCEVCGESRVDAHHDDYDEPLAVRWLCRRHHQQWHAERRYVPDAVTATADNALSFPAVCLPVSIPSRLSDIERVVILATLAQAGGNRTQAAALLGVSPKTLYSKLKSYNGE